jgi:hypothetical protein
MIMTTVTIIAATKTSCIRTTWITKSNGVSEITHATKELSGAKLTVSEALNSHAPLEKGGLANIAAKSE